MGTKISELTSASALDGTEQIAIVQGGVTKVVTADDLVSVAGTRAYRVRYNGTQQTISSNVWTTMTFDTTDYDTGGEFNLATNRFQPTVAGVYSINCATIASSTGVTGKGAILRFLKNGTDSVATGGDRHDAQEIITVRPSLTASIYMNGTTDYIEFQINSTNDASTLNNVNENTTSSAHLIGQLQGDSDWVAVTPSASWVSHSGVPMFYRKDSAGVVHMKGLAQVVDQSTTTVTTLPVGYRPNSQRHIICGTSTNTALMIRVDVNGTVKVGTMSGGTVVLTAGQWAAMDTVQFIADQ